MRLFRGILIVLSAVFSIATVSSAFSGYLNPVTWWFIALSGLVFLPLALINFIGFVILIATERKLFWIPLPGLLATMIKIPLVLQIGSMPTDEIQTNEKTLKVVSYNVRLFDLYNWSNSEETRQEIFGSIRKMNPDVICFQEFFSSKPRGLDNVKDLMELLGMPYYHTEYSITKFASDHYGVATFSKHPIIAKGVISQNRKSTNLSIYSDLMVGKDTIRVYNCHLQSIRLKADDYEFLEDPTQEVSNANLEKAFKIIKLMNKAYQYRSEQALQIAEDIKQSPHKTLLCGDFNDSPLSYTYKTLSDELSDAFMEMGSGLGQTYAGPIPGMRIDYILFGQGFQLLEFKTGKQKLSDHFPLEAKFKL